MKPESAFRDDVYKLMALVPHGQVVTYGDLAALSGHPYAARVVGQIAHFGPETLPWHRLVSKAGVMARGYWGGPAAHQAMLESEGVEIKDFKIVDFERYHWKAL